MREREVKGHREKKYGRNFFFKDGDYSCDLKYKNSLTSSRELKKVLANPELFLNAWTAACYEEGCALEREEAILRR